MQGWYYLKSLTGQRHDRVQTESQQLQPWTAVSTLVSQHGVASYEIFSWSTEWMNECVFIYRTYHIVSQGGLQFYLSEIGRQLVKAPLAAAISPYLISLTHPAHAWNVQWNNILHILTKMVMTSDETQIQILANWPMSHAKRVTRDNWKNPEYHVVAAIR